MNCQSQFFGKKKNKKNISKCGMLKFLPSTLSIKTDKIPPAVDNLIHKICTNFTTENSTKTKHFIQRGQVEILSTFYSLYSSR